MKKIEKMIHQIIRFRGNIEAFFVSIEEFSRSTNFSSQWTWGLVPISSEPDESWGADEISPTVSCWLIYGDRKQFLFSVFEQ